SHSRDHKRHGATQRILHNPKQIDQEPKLQIHREAAKTAKLFCCWGSHLGGRPAPNQTRLRALRGFAVEVEPLLDDVYADACQRALAELALDLQRPPMRFQDPPR